MTNQPPIYSSPTSSPSHPVTPSSDLTPRQLLALHALASGKHNHEAAAIANVNPHTITRWLQLPHFRIALNQELRDAVQQSDRRATHAADHALDILTQIMDSNADPTTKIRAAHVILQNRPPTRRILPHPFEPSPPMALAGFAKDLFQSLTP